jgi:hypothetical protein
MKRYTKLVAELATHLSTAMPADTAQRASEHALVYAFLNCDSWRLVSHVESHISRLLKCKPSSAIDAGFLWGNTPEGRSYWAHVFDEAQDKAKGNDSE